MYPAQLQSQLQCLYLIQFNTDVTASCTSSNTSFVLTMLVGAPASPATNAISGTISAFQNPFSVTPITITVGYLNQCTGTPSTLTKTLQFTQGVFSISPTADVTLASSSTVIGAQNLDLTVSFKPHTILQVKGIIDLIVPPYYSLTTGASTDSIISNNPLSPPSVTSSSMTIVASSVQFRPTDRTLTFQYTLSALVTNNVTNSLTFTVTGFNNPIDGTPLTGFALRTYDPQGNIIDNTVGSFSLKGVTTPATITQAAVELNSGQQFKIAQSGNDVTVSFGINFPVVDSCYVKITFPQDIKIDADDTISTYQGSGIIASSIIPSQVIKKPYLADAVISTCDCNYVVIPGCNDPSFLGATAQGIVILSTVVSPCQIKTTDNFQIDFYKDQAMTNQIATTSGLSLNFPSSLMIGGTITTTSFTPVTDNTVSESTDFRVTFTVTNNLYVNSTIDITAPTLITANSSTNCTIISTSSQFDTGVNCVVIQSTAPSIFRIQNPFSQSRAELFAMVVNPTNPASGTFTLQINGIINPPSVEQAGNWKVETKNNVSGSFYRVDSGASTLGSYIPAKGTLTASSNGGLIVSDRTTYSATPSYRFLISISHTIPQNGIIQLALPLATDYSIPVPTSLVCYHQDPTTTTTSYILQVCNQNGNSVLITLSHPAPSSAVLDLKIVGFKNPRTFQPTQSVSVTTMDQSSNLIDFGTGFSTSMNVMNTFSGLKVTMVNLTNGNTTTYTVSITTSVVPIMNGDILYLTWPSNVVLPSNAVCTRSIGISSIQCANSGQNMIVKLQTVSQSLGTYVFNVAGVRNPTSTIPSSAFTGVQITDASGYNVMQLLSTVKVTITTKYPANILAYSLYQDNLALGAKATYKISFTPTNMISPTGSIVIGWPSQVTIETDVGCQVTTNQKFSNKCTINSQTSTIVITNAFSTMASYFSGSILVELYPVTNPIDNQIVDGFTISTYDDAAQVYPIDALGADILIPQTACNYPCNTCLGSQPDYCLSCWPTDQNKFLQTTSTASVCQSSCSPGYTSNGDPNKVCIPCDPTCKTCADNGVAGDKLKCLTCSSITPFYYKNLLSCKSQCEAGYYQSAQNQCSPCQAPCQQCSSNSTVCTSCYQNSTLPYLANSTCIANCPAQYVGVSNVCLHCQSPCKTCVNSTNQCTLCDQTTLQKFLFAYQCYQVCPIGTVNDTVNMTCKGCLAGCLSCNQANQSICYKCSSPLVLYDDACLTDCPAGYKINSNGDGCDVIATTALKDLTLIYFPHLICCVLMTVICIGGFCKDRKSIIITNMIVLFAPVEMLSLIVQLILSLFYSARITTYATGFAIVSNLLLNWIFFSSFSHKIGQKDEDYKFWRNLHPRTASFIMFLSGVLSFKIVRLQYSYLFGFDNFKARFSHPDYFRRILMVFTFLHIICSNGVIIAIDALDLMSSFQLKNQMQITQVETGAIGLIMILLSCIELCRNRRQITFDYSRMEQDSQVYNSQMEEGADKQMRREMLKKIMSQFKAGHDLLNDQSINHRVDELIEKFRPRRCNSIGPVDNEHEDDPRRVKSEPPSPKPDWDSMNPSNLTKENVDNVYAESKPSDPLGRFGKTFTDAESQVLPDEFGRVIHRKGVDFLNLETPDSMLTKKSQRNKKRGRKNQYYTQIDAEDDEEADHLEEASKEVVMEDNVDNLGVIREEDDEEEKKIKQKKEQIKKQEERNAEANRMAEDSKRLEDEIAANTLSNRNSHRELPEGEDPPVQVPPDSQKRTFNENDILGEFDRDEKGNIVLLQDEKGNYVDKLGRRVNERGYLIDAATGDIIENQKQRTMFQKEDIDDRGEIPAPFCVEKHNFNPFKLRGEFNYDKSKRPIIAKNKAGELVDKRGRLVNKKGWLADKNGNVLDNLGIKKFDKRQLIPETGDLPRLLNYGGQRYDIMDVCGTFDLDRTGNIIIRKNDKGQSFDKQGRLVNQRGYLIDQHGNVVDSDGKKIFERRYLSSNGDFPKIFPFTKFNIKNIQGEFEMDPMGNPILERNSDGKLVDRDGKLVNQRGYFIDAQGNIIDKKGKIMFNRDILDQDGEIPEVFRAGLLKSDTASSLSRLMSEIERNQPEEMYAEQKKGAINKRSQGGNSSIESRMDDTPSNYNEANMRIDPRKKQSKLVRIDESKSSIEDGLGSRRRKLKKKKKVPGQEYSDPSEKDLQMAKAYGGIARGAPKRVIPKGINVRGVNSPSSSMSKRSKLKGVAGSVAGFQRNQQSMRELEEEKKERMSNAGGNLNQNQSMVMFNGTNEPSLLAVPDHHIREQELKKQKLKELKMKGKQRKVKPGAGDPDFEKMFGKDIDEFLEDSDWDIESFENMSNFSRGTARSAFLDGRIRGLESIYLQRIESSMKRGGNKTKKSEKKPQFRVMQDRFISDPAAVQDIDGLSSHHSQQRQSRAVANAASMSNSSLGQQYVGQEGARQLSAIRNKAITSHTQYRAGPDLAKRKL